jgi:hypothetical protein
MAERTVITELVQLGVESAYGTSVAATKKLASMGFDISPEFGTTRVRPMGYKIDSIVAPMREWAAGDISGYPTYNELPYVFNSLLKKVTPTTTTGVSTWTWTPSPTSVEAVDSFTIEQGDAATRAQKVTGGLITDWNATWTRTGDPDMGGMVLAQAFVDGITPTAALALAQPIPILPTHIDVYADATWAGAGTTKLLRVMSAGVSIGGMWGPLWVLNTTLTSYASFVQQAPDVTFTLTLEADSTGMAYLTQMRAGTGVALQLKATGPNIVEGPPDLGETDGVRTATWTFRGAVDAVSGNFISVVMKNGVSAL